MNFGTTVKVVGGLLPQQLLERVAAGDAALPGTRPADYHEDSANGLSQAMSRAWAALTGRWANFQAARAQIPANERATTLTRERWLLPLFQELGYGRLQAERGAIETGGRTFAVSHRWGHVPLHLVGVGVHLDRPAGGERGGPGNRPHGLVQDLLNHADGHLWGMATNGLVLRLLRDHRSLTRQAYVEFDLEAMFAGEHYSAFRVLYLLCHVSRVEATDPGACILEQWHKHAKEDGVRALGRLRACVEQALVALGAGFLKHRANDDLRARLSAGTLTVQDYYRQLLRLAYRLIFLFVAEDRDMLLDRDAPPDARQRFQRLYATRRLRTLAMQRRGGPHSDGWHVLRLVMRQLDRGNPDLALPALGSFLWAGEDRDGDRRSKALPDLDPAQLTNEDLYRALRDLCTLSDANVRRPVDWAGVQADELGSVYESLMEQVPELNAAAGEFRLRAAAGNERKTTGSYYTPDSLVQCLLDSALDPVLEEACKAKDPEQAVLALSVVDPACGSGHFLVAAARRIAMRLARLRSGGVEPSPEEVQHATRDVVGHCIYGVDLNPMAVELCKVSLWMEALEPGRPLSFLDAHIQRGNALLGATPELLEAKDANGLAVGIPDDAFAALEGDDKPTVSLLKKRNKAARTQRDLFGDKLVPIDFAALGAAMAKLDADGDGELEDVARKAAAYEGYLASPEYRRAKLIADAWCAAFVWHKLPGMPALTNAEFLNLRAGHALTPPVEAEVRRLAEEYQFFHWHLQFPDVFAGAGGGQTGAAVVAKPAIATGATAVVAAGKGAAASKKAENPAQPGLWD
ncbi:MAG: N-6 DNA methylase [Deltaproteobacteria bacterium]|nr:N-6 DNA methylase [Deltaproteobacteria bacterium]